MKATCTLSGMESLLQERLGEEERHPVPEIQMGLKDLNTGGAASSQQLALGGFTAAKAARRRPQNAATPNCRRMVAEIYATLGYITTHSLTKLN
jgi:hypothetical protein